MIKLKQLQEILKDYSIIESAPMKDHCSFKIGGPCRFLLLPENISQLKKLLKTISSTDEKYLLIGRGTDLLFMDEGYDGLVIKLAGQFQKVEIEEDKGLIYAGAGISMRELAEAAGEASLTGLEFAHGIPGSVGGGTFMNAGAYDGESKELIKKVFTVTADGNQEKVYEMQECAFAYRHSIFQENGEIITKVIYELERGEREAIFSKMEELMAKRRSKQPLDLPSAGSFFKRPSGYYAGKLIQDSGLQGLRIGGARISTLHAGFIVNEGNASSEDIIHLMHLVQFRVKEKYGVSLEPEVRIIEK